jgi:hypothetical protein
LLFGLRTWLEAKVALTSRGDFDEIAVVGKAVQRVCAGRRDADLLVGDDLSGVGSVGAIDGGGVETTLG